MVKPHCIFFFQAVRVRKGCGKKCQLRELWGLYFLFSRGGTGEWACVVSENKRDAGHMAGLHIKRDILIIRAVCLKGKHGSPGRGFLTTQKYTITASRSLSQAQQKSDQFFGFGDCFRWPLNFLLPNSQVLRFVIQENTTHAADDKGKESQEVPPAASISSVDR